MTVGLDPQCTSHDQPLLIHTQALHGGSLCRRQALYPARVFYPPEMILPMLPAGMKQEGRRACGRIQGRGGRGFTEVAGGTRQAQILQSIAPVGINVLHVHCLANSVPTCLTVFTTIPCAFMDQAHDGRP
jgi:hypothetical protein